MREPVITLTNITKTFPGEKETLPAVKNVSLEIAAGEFFVFVGPSGSGKSTLLRIMSGLEKDFSGSVVLGGGISAADMSFVFQQFALLPWLTVLKNVELGLMARDAEITSARRRAERELSQLGLEHFAGHYPRELSGGMRQRVGIARALATDPKIIFMDEPFSELDSFTAAELRKEILAIWKRSRTTIVMVTHIIEEALELADRIAVLTPRPGKIETVLTNDLPRPREKRSPAFYGLEDRVYKLIRP